MLLLRVHAGSHPRRHCPVFIDLDLPADQPIVLQQEPGQRPRKCQLEPMPSGSRLWWFVSRLDPGQTADYRLTVTPDRRKPLVNMHWQESAPGQWELQRNDKPIARYGVDTTQPFLALGPLFAPGDANDAAIERAWFSGQLAGIPHASTATSVCDPPMAGPVFARFQRRGFWLGPKRERLAEEVVSWTWFAASADSQLIDMDASILASTGPARFAATASGGFLSLRLPLDLWTAPNLTLQNSVGGMAAAEIQGHPASWLLAAAENGVAVFDHPENLGSPATWHLSDDGVLAANPFGAMTRYADLLPEQPSVLAVGEALSFRYRFCLQSTALEPATTQRHFCDFAFPPRVEIVERS